MRNNEIEKNASFNKLESLQALRAISFIGIFLLHANAPIQWSNLGVTVFFTLSGFLMVWVHGNDEIGNSFTSRIKYSWNRVKKIYSLHILTLIFSIILHFALLVRTGKIENGILEFLKEIVLNVFLLQSWYPDSDVNTSLNGVAWFLSVICFLYFIFPSVNKLVHMKKKKTLLAYCILIILAEWLTSYIALICWGQDSKIYYWYTYFFPIFRAGDFFVGCCLAITFTGKRHQERRYIVASVYEILAIVFSVIAYIWLEKDHTSLLVKALCNDTTGYILLAVIWIYLFTLNEGIVTKILSNKYLILLGDISSYTFLIHYVIIQYVYYLLSHYGIDLARHGVLSAWKLWIIIILEFLATIIAAIIYKHFRTKCKLRVTHNSN